MRAPLWCVLLSFLLAQLVLLLVFSDGLLGIGSAARRHKPDFELQTAQWQEALRAYVPGRSVAWAIPTGGTVNRAGNLRTIINTLVSSGVSANNIFVFEDEQGRPDQRADVHVLDTAAAAGVRVVLSGVLRGEREVKTTFGRYLARHYRFLLDYLLSDSDKHRTFEYAVVLEDDLGLAPDLVSFFHSMSRLMHVDPTVYCVAAHQDNAFQPVVAGHAEDPMLDLDFDFRRGNHFMAPGWMTSKRVYAHVRASWLDEQGNYFKAKGLGLLNGHWDRFFDSMIGQADCVFPERPRIVHMAGEGFTVGQTGQAELYEGQVLATRSAHLAYPDVLGLGLDRYIQRVEQFIASAILVPGPEAILAFRQQRLVLLVPATSDADNVWNAYLVGFFGLVGVGGYGGNPKYAKLRGVHRGTVFVRWAGNLVLLVGRYSPYSSQMQDKEDIWQLRPASYLGCFKDEWTRDLPHLISWPATYGNKGLVSIQMCTVACALLGFAKAGLQAQEECWCGQEHGQHGLAVDGVCDSTCAGQAWELAWDRSVHCGGAWANAVYQTPTLPSGLQLYVAASPNSPADVDYVFGAAGQSCDDVCAERQTQCVANLLPLLLSNCEALKHLTGCEACKEAGTVEWRLIAPGLVSGIPLCLLGRGKDLRCESKAEQFRRACVCR